MGQRELLLVLGALTIFGTTTLTANRFVVDQSDAMLQHEFGYFAASLAQGYLEEAKSMAFDENVIHNTPGSLPSGFGNPSGVAKIGPESGETYGTYDDVDDFDGYSETIDSGRGDFVVNVAVGYVNAANPDTITTVSETFFKKMTVTVTNDMLDYPVNMSYVFAYIKN
jgi:hypothetical protein